MSGTDDINLQRHLEQAQTPTLKQSNSSERLAQFHRQDEQIAALQRGSNQIDAQRIATASPSQPGLVNAGKREKSEGGGKPNRRQREEEEETEATRKGQKRWTRWSW